MKIKENDEFLHYSMPDFAARRADTQRRRQRYCKEQRQRPHFAPERYRTARFSESAVNAPPPAEITDPPMLNRCRAPASTFRPSRPDEPQMRTILMVQQPTIENVTG